MATVTISQPTRLLHYASVNRYGAFRKDDLRVSSPLFEDPRAGTSLTFNVNERSMSPCGEHRGLRHNAERRQRRAAERQSADIVGCRAVHHQMRSFFVARVSADVIPNLPVSKSTGVLTFLPG
jgi:hypothetical protein